MKCLIGITTLWSLSSSQAYAPNAASSKAAKSLKAAESKLSRQDFLYAAAVITTATSLVFSPLEAAQARGRATLEFACDRYYPRLEAGGAFYASDLKKAIEKNDWAAIKVRIPSSASLQHSMLVYNE
eukprot:scaffold2184_cov266-Chaetoceros_neogracile.AAC.11